VTEQRAKKDEYQKVLTAFGQAVKEFHKGDFERAVEHLEGFIEKFPSEPEVVDRARMYLAIARKRLKKESLALKGFEDYCHYAIIRINQGDYDGATKLLQKALEYKEKEGLVYYLLADVHCLIGQPEAGLMTGGVYSLGGGFWGGGAVATPDEFLLFLPLVMRSY